MSIDTSAHYVRRWIHQHVHMQHANLLLTDSNNVTQRSTWPSSKRQRYVGWFHRMSDNIFEVVFEWSADTTGPLNLIIS